jgi:tRNA dimethylallyltransferase
MNKTCIIIAGPTAVGKTALAISIASYFSTRIISADSRQCYKELDIGVAKPSPAQLEAVPHHFIGTHSITESVTAARFEQEALLATAKIFEHHDIVVMVGGTGLYIKAFCEGMDDIPPADESTRNRIIQNYQSQGLSWLQSELLKLDPEFYHKGEIKNPQRCMRALEVVVSTGRSILSYLQHQPKQRDFDIIKTGLELPRNLLYERINNRVNQMMADGLYEEVRSLIPYKNCNALQTVGYRELFDHFEGKTSLERAVELIKQNTRHYAKRQMTWFKKDEAFNWFPPDTAAVLKYIRQKSEPGG